jgi:uncharacterized protein DUF6941
MILCDYAEEIGGKLYIVGGGWSRTARAGVAGDFYLAAKLLVPWTDSNRPHVLRLALKTGDGQDVMQGEQAVQVIGKLEVGRPPGLVEGTDLDLPLALPIKNITLPEGRYRWEMAIDENIVTDLSFDVTPPPTVSLRLN